MRGFAEVARGFGEVVRGFSWSVRDLTRAVCGFSLARNPEALTEEELKQFEIK